MIYMSHLTLICCGWTFIKSIMVTLFPFIHVPPPSLKKDSLMNWANFSASRRVGPSSSLTDQSLSLDHCLGTVGLRQQLLLPQLIRLSDSDGHRLYARPWAGCRQRRPSVVVRVLSLPGHAVQPVSLRGEVLWKGSYRTPRQHEGGL